MAHSALYLSYQGGHITAFVLLRAAAVDALIILILIIAAQRILVNKTAFVLLTGIAVAVAVELWALETGRWAYGAAMPIVPILKTGLTPTIQLAITGYLTQKIYEKYSGPSQEKGFPS